MRISTGTKLTAVMGLVLAWCISGCSCGDVVRKEPSSSTPSKGDQRDEKCIPFVQGAVFSVQRKETQIRDVAWGPLGETFATVSQDGRIQIRKANTGIIQEKYEYSVTSDVWKIAYTPDGQGLVTIGSDGAVRLWKSGKEDRSFLPPQSSLQGRALAVIQFKQGSQTRTMFVAGYQTDDGKGALSWQSLDDSQPGPAAIETTEAAVRSVAFRPDGLITAVGLANGTLELRDTLTGKRLLQREAAHKEAIQGLTWSPDGQTLASGSTDTTVQVWRVPTNATSMQPIQTLRGHRYPVTSVSFSPGGEFLASVSSDSKNGRLGALKIWDTKVMEPGKESIREYPQPSFEAKQGAWSVSWHPDKASKKILLGSFQGSSWVWVMDNYPVYLYGRTPIDAITSMAQSNDDARWVYGTDQGAVHLLLPNVKEPVIKKFTSPVIQVGWDPDKEHAVAALANGEVHKWDWKNDTVTSHKDTTTALTSMAIRRDATGFLLGYEDGHAVFLHPTTLTPQGTWKSLHSGAIRSMHWSHDGNLLATASDTGEIKVWSYNTPSEQPTLLHTFQAPSGHQPVTVRFNPTDTKLAVGMTGGVLAIWQRYTNQWENFTTSHETSLLAWQRADTNVLWTAAAPTDSRKNTVLHMWDTSDPTKLRHVHTLQDEKNGHTKALTGLYVNWNAQTVTTGGLDGAFKVWKTRRAYPILQADYTDSPISLAVRPDGQQIVAGTTGSLIHIWKLNGNQTPSLQLLQGHSQSVLHVALNTTGDQLYTVALDGKLLQWDVEKASQQAIRSYPNEASTFKPATNVRGMSLNPAQTHAVVGGYAASNDINEGQLVIWNLSNPGQPDHIFDKILRIHSLVWHPTRDIIITGHHSGTIRIWEKEQGKWSVKQTTPEMHPLGVSTLAIDPKSGDLVASTSRYGDIRVWRLSDGKQVYRLDSGGSSVSRLLFHPSGHALAASLSNGQVKIWRLSDGKLTHLLVDPKLKQEGYPVLAHEGPVNTMAWSTDGNTLFTGGADLTIKQWHCAK